MEQVIWSKNNRNRSWTGRTDLGFPRSKGGGWMGILGPSFLAVSVFGRGMNISPCFPPTVVQWAWSSRHVIALVGFVRAEWAKGILIKWSDRIFLNQYKNFLNYSRLTITFCTYYLSHCHIKKKKTLCIVWLPSWELEKTSPEIKHLRFTCNHPPLYVSLQTLLNWNRSQG